MLFDNENEKPSNVSLEEHPIVMNIEETQYKIELPALNIQALNKPQEYEIIPKRKIEDTLFRRIINSQFQTLKENANILRDSEKYRIRIASLHSLIGESKEALEILSKPTPSDSNLLYETEIGKNLLQLNDSDGLKHLNKNDPEATHTLALWQLKTKKFSEAESTLTEYYLNNSFDQKINTLFSILKILKNDFPGSIKLLRENNKHCDINSSNSFLLSLNYLYLKNVKRAKKWAMIGSQINPYNKNIILLYCYLCILENDNSIIPILKKYLSFKEDEEITERLARFYYYNGKIQKAIDLLNKMIATNDKNPSTWNNLALSFQNSGKPEKSQAIFLHAFDLMKNNLNYQIIENTFKFLFIKNEFKIIINLYEEKNLNSEIELTTTTYLNIHYFYLYSVLQSGNESEFLIKIEEVDNSTDDPELKLIISNDLISHFSTNNLNFDKLNYYLKRILKYESEVDDKDKKIRFINNYIFASLEIDQFPEENMLQFFKNNLGTNPYFYATYGLYFLKLGNLDKGVLYYEKSIMFCSNNDQKHKFRLKRDLELAKTYIKLGLISNAKTYLERVIKHSKDKFTFYGNQALSILLLINRQPH